MQRPESHEIDARAKRIFEYKFPGNIIVRTQTIDDYGIDAEIELFRNGHSTGTIFKIQLKGQKSPEIGANSNTIAYSFPVRKGTYLIEQIEIPTVFILVDVTQEIVYWCDIHSNQELIAEYLDAKDKGRDSFTIYFHTHNVLPGTLSELLETIITSAHHIALRHVSRIKAPVYADYVTNLQSVENEINHLSQKFEIATVEKLRRLIELKVYDEAEDLINLILSSPERSHEAKFDAVFYSERIFVRKYGGQKGGITKVEFDISFAEELTKLALASQNPKLQVLAEAFSLSARLGFLVNRDMQLFHNWRTHHDSSGNLSPTGKTIPFWIQFLELERTSTARKIWNTYEELANNISNLIAEDWLSVPDLITRVIFNMTIFLVRMNEEGLSENVKYTRNLIDGLIDFVVALSEKIPEIRVRDTIFDRCAMAYEMQIGIYPTEEELKQQISECALKVIEHIIDDELKAEAQARLAARLQKKYRWSDPKDVDWNAVTNYYRNQAKAIGVNFELVGAIIDRNHPSYREAEIARNIDVGIRDLNPHRILKNCKHLIYAFTGGISEYAKILNLPSARRKVIGCVLHIEHGVLEGAALDALYEQFHENYCAKCPHSEAYEVSWQFTDQWHSQRMNDWQHAQAEFIRKNHK